MPPIGAGTSIVALSDSSVTSGSSGCTMSPGFTNTSITGTSLKSTMSGTRTGNVGPAGGVALAPSPGASGRPVSPRGAGAVDSGAGDADVVDATGAARGAASRASTTLPSLT